VRERLRSLPVIGTALAVQERYGQVGGGALAQGIALAGFLSLFPLLLVAIAVAGYLSAGDAGWIDEIVGELGLTGTAADTLRTMLRHAEDSRRAASVIGLLGLLWSGLGVVAAVQRMIDRTWQATGRGLRDKLVALGWLAGAAAVFVASFGLSALLNVLPGALAPLGIAAGIGLNFVLFLWTFKALGRQLTGWGELLRGALLCGIGFEVLKIVGAVYVPRLVASSSSLYGPLGVVFAILAWLAFFGQLLTYGSVLNVVNHEAGHGTVVVQLEVPKVDGRVPLTADRSGSVTEVVTA
jgi:membrane protein